MRLVVCGTAVCSGWDLALRPDGDAAESAVLQQSLRKRQECGTSFRLHTAGVNWLCKLMGAFPAVNQSQLVFSRDPIEPRYRAMSCGEKRFIGYLTVRLVVRTQAIVLLNLRPVGANAFHRLLLTQSRCHQIVLLPCITSCAVVMPYRRSSPGE